MQDRVFPREAAERLQRSPRTIQRWINEGRGGLSKDAEGKISYQKAKRIHLNQRTGRRPGKLPKSVDELLAKLPKNDRSLHAHFLQPTYGQRRLALLIDSIALAAAQWKEAQRKRWADKLRDGASAVEHAEPTGARERQRKAAAKRTAYREAKRQWRNKRDLVERPEDVIPQLTDGEPFRF
jgi:hypothetical protein